MDREPPDHGSGSREKSETAPDTITPRRRSGLSGLAGWLRETNTSPTMIGVVRRARKALPGDSEFGDPLSTAGEGGPQAAARAADRLMGDRSAASREVGLGALQVWQALTERVSRRPANAEVTLVFTDLVGFSTWALRAGDDATLTLLRRAAQAIEPPLLEAGGHIVKRMGDGTMAVFRDPLVAVGAVLSAQEALETVRVGDYTPRMRAGVHTGRPQRLASDWLGVDVNIAARVMERATRGGIVVSATALDQISPTELEALGAVAKRVRRPVFGQKQTGVPPELSMYRLEPRSESSGAEHAEPDAQA